MLIIIGLLLGGFILVAASLVIWALDAVVNHVGEDHE